MCGVGFRAFLVNSRASSISSASMQEPSGFHPLTCRSTDDRSLCTILYDGHVYINCRGIVIRNLLLYMGAHTLIVPTIDDKD